MGTLFTLNYDNQFLLATNNSFSVHGDVKSKWKSLWRDLPCLRNKQKKRGWGYFLLKNWQKCARYILSLVSIYSYVSVRRILSAGICACGSIEIVCTRVQANDGPGHCRLKEMRCSEGKTQALALTLTYMTDVYWMFLLLWVVSLYKDKTSLTSSLT